LATFSDHESVQVQIKGLLREGRVEAARVAIATALDHWPDDLALLLREGECLELEGKAADAEAHFRSLCDRYPESVWPANRLIVLLLKRDAASEARSLFFERVWTAAAPEELKRGLLNQLTVHPGPLASTEAFLEGLLGRGGYDGMVLAKLAGFSLRRNRIDEAIIFLDRAAALGPLRPETMSLRLDLLIAAGRHSEVLAHVSDLCRSRPDRPDYVWKAVTSAGAMKRFAETAHWLELGLAQWPEHWMFVYRYNRAPLERDADQAIFETIERNAARIDGDDDRFIFQHAQARLRNRDAAAVLPLLARIGPESRVDFMAMPLRRVLAAQEERLTRTAARFEDDRTRSVQIVAAPDARATLVVFAGVNASFCYLPFSQADRLFSAFPANVVYLRDFRDHAYVSGIDDVGQDEAATIAGLKSILAELGPRCVITMGGSIGGYAAARYGVLMGATAAISFAGPTNLTGTHADLEDGEFNTRFRTLRHLVHRNTDLAPLIAAAPETRVIQCYGADHAIDTAEAGRLATLANVTPLALAGISDHSTAMHLIATGDFDRLIADLIGSGS
jgi:tetratricopeptide (TPR) repeat protein